METQEIIRESWATAKALQEKLGKFNPKASPVEIEFTNILKAGIQRLKSFAAILEDAVEKRE